MVREMNKKASIHVERREIKDAQDFSYKGGCNGGTGRRIDSTSNVYMTAYGCWKILGDIQNFSSL